MNTSPRRLYLSVTLKLLLLLAGVMLIYVFAASLRGSAGVSDNAPPGMEVDLAGLGKGEIQRVEAFGRVVWILHRDAPDLAVLGVNAPHLHDADSAYSQQPDHMRTSGRSLLPEFFVFLPFESKRHCQVRWTPALNDQAGEFTEPCYGARFDPAGRIYKGSGDPAQQNLAVPAYERISATRIRLLPPG